MRFPNFAVLIGWDQVTVYFLDGSMETEQGTSL